MAAPRATQFVALRNLARHGSHHQQVRSLHMTGPATYASPVLTQERSILNIPRDIAGLRAECKRRRIDASGDKQDLIARINADQLAHHRAFSTTSPTRPTPTTSPNTSAAAGNGTRHFNTSRSLKAVNDSSTIDFAYMPWTAADHDDSHPTLHNPQTSSLRVPIIPSNLVSSSSSRISRQGANTLAPTDEFSHAETVMKPTISTMSADAMSLRAVLPLAELSDCHGLHIDFHEIAERSVGDAVEKLAREDLSGGRDRGVGVLKQIWEGIVQDFNGGGTGNGRKFAMA